jgi:carbon monoxide dehydrogenase subunit G
MATLHKDIFIGADPEQIWDAVRDVGALHTRLVPGFVRDTRVEGETRVVTFADGVVVREPILSVDDDRRRMAWTAEGGATTHYNAVLQVFPEGTGSRVVWTSDLLPNGAADSMGAMQDLGLAAMKKTFEKGRMAGLESAR